MGKSIIEMVAEERQKKDEDERRRYKMRQRVHELRGQGMDTSRLEKALADPDIEVAAKAFVEYDQRLAGLAAAWNRLYTIDFRGFESDYQEIYSRLRDPFALEELNSMLDRLEKAVKERRESEMKAQEEERKKREEDLKRYNLEQVIMSWKSRGYATEELEALLKEGDIEKTREAVAKFESEVRRLWEIGRRLMAMDLRGFEEEAKVIQAMLYDVTKVEEAETKLGVLEAKVGESMKERSAKWQEEEAQRKAYEETKRKEEEAQLQEEARKAAEAKRQAKEEWERKLADEKQAVAKTRVYLNNLTEHMKELQPMLSPLGLYLGDRKWTITKQMDKMEVVGKVSAGFFSEHLEMMAHFFSAAQLPSVKDLHGYFKAQGDKYKSKGMYIVDCVIMNRLSQPSIETVEKFSHTNCAAILYDIAEGKIYYNSSSFGADMYAGFFTVGGQPKSLKEIFKPISDQYEVIYKKDVGPKFGMAEDEVERMIDHLERTNRIYPVEKRKGSFSFA